MFLDLTLARNPKLIDTAFFLHRNGIIKPDTYVLDLDTIVENARLIKNEADRYGVKLYFMTKQFGRNPYIAGELMKLGFEGAVAVDFKEADTLYKNGIKIGHVGHLVQVPSKEVKDMLLKKPEVVTVYSLKKAREISDAAVDLGITQNIMLRIVGQNDVIYPGQYGGFGLEGLIENAKRIIDMPNLILYGLTSFPCFLMDSESKEIKETNNMMTILKAKEMLKEQLNINIIQLNAPSATCVSSIKKIAQFGGTHGEPGHGLSGTTPLHAVKNQPEIPAIVYVSEVSHNFGDKAYIYGGGYYRRSNMRKALVGTDAEYMESYEVEKPSDSGIDYYIGLNGKASVGDTAVLAFRTQIFVTRSEVAVVKGIRGGSLEVVGIYDSFGKLMKGGA
jgi:Predicted amino acid racemase